jgi:hypothetical protein
LVIDKKNIDSSKFHESQRKTKKTFKEELKSALISIKEVTEGKRKEVTLEEFLSKK